jgi:hypothetical protein
VGKLRRKKTAESRGNEKKQATPFIKKHLSEKISNISLVNEFDSFAD